MRVLRPGSGAASLISAQIKISGIKLVLPGQDQRGSHASRARALATVASLIASGLVPMTSLMSAESSLPLARQEQSASATDEVQGMDANAT